MKFFQISNLVFESKCDYKTIALYYRLLSYLPNCRNRFKISLDNIFAYFNYKKDKDTKKRIVERLNILHRANLISLQEELTLNIKFGDYFKLKFISEDSNFTKMLECEVEILDEMNDIEVAVFLYLKRCYNHNEGYSFPSCRNMQEKLEIGSLSSLSKTLNSLVNYGLIRVVNDQTYSVEDGKIRKKNNKYFINTNLPNFDQAETIINTIETLRSDEKEKFTVEKDDKVLEFNISKTLFNKVNNVLFLSEIYNCKNDRFVFGGVWDIKDKHTQGLPPNFYYTITITDK